MRNQRDLKGLTPLRNSLVLNTGNSRRNGDVKSFKFLCPLTNIVVNTYRKMDHKKLLNKLEKSYEDIILLINGKSRDELKVCEVCKTNKVRLFTNKNPSANDLLKPYEYNTCYNKKCRNSHKMLVINSKMSESDRSKRSRSGYTTQLKNNRLNLRSPESIQKEKLTKLNNNSYDSYVTYDDNNKIHKFHSKSELKVFIKYRRILTKNYSREVLVSQYEVDGSLHNYVADYKKNSNSNLPDVIEVKGNLKNFNIGWRGVDESVTNYLKFKSVIDLGLTLLIINTNRLVTKLHYIKNEKDLNMLFKKVKK